jgi:ribosomal protein S12 methylthiotransferase
VTLRTTFIWDSLGDRRGFLALADFVENEVRPAGVFAYSREEGSAAAALKGQVPERLKRRRLDDIRSGRP